jgi:uncharacterized protein YndB with AHSA1/START domain
MPPDGDRFSVTVNATPEQVYRAFTDPAALVQWLPPGEMTGRLHNFDLRVGGGYRMSLFYPTGGRGKTAANEDMVDVRFVELSPPHRIVETARFQADDPRLAGEMTIIVTLSPTPAGTEVAMAFHDLPPGVSAEDNAEGARLSLTQLARHLAAGRELA